MWGSCRCICPSSSGSGRRDWRGGEMLAALWSAMLAFDPHHWKNSSYHNWAWGEKHNQKNGGKPTVIMLMFVVPHPPTPLPPCLCVPVPKVADMTQHTPPHTSACVQTCHWSGYHSNYCFCRLLWLMFGECIEGWDGGGVVRCGLVATQSRGEWKRIWLCSLLVFALSSLGCLFGTTLPPTILAAKTLNLVWCGFLFTFTLSTRFFFFLPLFFFSVPLPSHLLCSALVSNLWQS